jgi:predicted metal-dependent hydrolase
MPKKIYSIQSPDGKIISVTIQRDKRLKKTARWGKEPDGGMLVRIPYRMRNAEIPELLETIQGQFSKQKKRAKRRTHADLQTRARYINRTYFNNKINWEAIRWVPPMKTRLGSCTTGGPTDGHIRISEEIKEWPQWVIDYVIAHEMTHRLHPDHSTVFWNTLTEAYPLTERARGFIKGVGYARGVEFEGEEG